MLEIRSVLFFWIELKRFKGEILWKKTISRNLNNNSLQYFESSDFSVDSSELKNEKKVVQLKTLTNNAK